MRVTPKLLIAAGLCSAGLMMSASVSAKLPPLSPEAKDKAAEAAAKAAWSDKVAAFQLCKSIDRTAAGYFKSAKAAGKDTAPPMETPACADPGPFVYAPAAAASAPATTTAAAPPAPAGKPAPAPAKK